MVPLQDSIESVCPENVLSFRLNSMVKNADLSRNDKGKMRVKIDMLFQAPATIVVPSSGSYKFQFWRCDGQTLDTTLTFQ